VEGDAAPANQELALNGGKRVGLEHLLPTLEGVLATKRPLTTVDVRAALAGLSVAPPIPASARSGMQQVKDAALMDLAGFERSQRRDDPAAVRAWLTEALSQYEQWLARIPMPR